MFLLEFCANYVDYCHHNIERANKYYYELSFRYLKAITNKHEDDELKQFFNIN